MMAVDPHGVKITKYDLLTFNKLLDFIVKDSLVIFSNSCHVMEKVLQRVICSMSFPACIYWEGNRS